MPDPSVKRLFVAVTFRPESAFADKFRQLRQCTYRTDRVNWVNPELFHLTLKFLGETERGRIPSLCQALSEAARTVSPFSFTLDRIGAFGSRYQPRVVWLGTDEMPEGMLQLHNSIERKLFKLGFPKTFGNFVCHLTLARINRIENKQFFWEGIQACRQLFAEKVDVHEFVLYESLLQQGHAPRYVALERFPLSEKI